ncbi:unnamed protein product, partial [Lampetra planeri]
EPDIPAWAPLLYQLQLLEVREKPDPLTLPVADRIRIGQPETRARKFSFPEGGVQHGSARLPIALEVLTTGSRDGNNGAVEAEEEEVRDYRVKCFEQPGCRSAQTGAV